MKITYNGLALHEIGTVKILSQRSSIVPPEAPVLRRVELNIRVDFTESNWWLNHVLQNRVTAALANPHADLVWLNDDLPTSALTAGEAAAGGRRVFSGRAMLTGHDLPEDPNAWGTSQQAVLLSFAYEDPEIDTSLFDATFTPLVGSAINLGTVTEFGYAYAATRYSVLHDERSRATGTVTVRGLWSPRVSQSADEPAGLGPIVPTLSELRSGIIAQFNAVLTAVNQKRGNLRFGQRAAESMSPVALFNQTVRVSAFTGQPDQHNKAVPWSLTAEYSLFPNESGYALADFTVRTRKELEGGAYLLTLAGQIVASSRAEADLKLDSIRTAMVPSGAVMTGSSDPNEQHIDGPDGATFLQFNFDETYRVARDAGLVRIQYRVEVETDYLALQRRTSVRGQVGCASRSEGNTALAALLASSEFTAFGTLVRNSRGEARLTDGTTTHLTEFAFANEYLSALSEQEADTSLVDATFTPDVGSAINLGPITEFGLAYAANRYSVLHDQRSRAGGTVTVRGLWSPTVVSPSVPGLSDFRSGIMAQFNAVLAGVNQKRGTLRIVQRASSVELFSQVVRVSAFTGQPDQQNKAMPWSLTAEYSFFPNEGGYALAEFTVRTRKDLEGGAFLLTLAGQIFANSRSAADLKLDSIRAAMVPSGAVMTGSSDPNEQHIDGPDGATFLQFNFDETYRVARDAGLVRIQYRVEVETDYLALQRRTSVRGQVGCASRSEGNTALAALLGSSEFTAFGTLVRDSRGEGRLTDGTTTYLTEFTFANEYQAALSGQEGIIECNVSESIRHTGVRWVIRDTAFGRPLAQACGYEPGNRSVRAQVVAVDEATARTWLNSQYALAFPATAPSTRYRRPPEFSTSWTFAPRVTGIARGSGANAQVVRGDMSAEEYLLDYDFTG